MVVESSQYFLRAADTTHAVVEFVLGAPATHLPSQHPTGERNSRVRLQDRSGLGVQNGAKTS